MLLVAIAGCTPVDPVSKPTDKPAITGDIDAAVPPAQFETGGDSCSSPGARSCEAGDPSRKPLLCENGAWRGQTACQEDQRCDVEPGATYGTCVKIAAACIGRRPNTDFCEGEAVRFCSGGIVRLRRVCGAQQTCLEKENQVVCECSPGAVESGGMCRIGTSCQVDNGGCDNLTQCDMQRGRRTCSLCPEGYTGDGSTGCAPALLSLRVNQGELNPALSHRDFNYRLRLPLIQQQVTLTPQVAAGVQVQINGSPLGAGSAWSSGPLALGTHSVIVTLTAASGLTSRYAIDIERLGAEEAFLTQRTGEEFDSFGWSLAISGDTLAVGTPGDDSAKGGGDADASDNKAAESGAVYVFIRQNGTWTQQAYLKPSEPRGGAFFGVSVALDGDTLIVGAIGSSYYSLTQASGYPPRPGSAYVFQRENGKWSQRAELRSPSSQPDKFGFRIALDASNIVVGAPSDAEGGDQAGAVYVVPRSDSFGPLLKLHSPQPAAGALFGYSMALDGDTLLVGSPHNTARSAGVGAVFAYRASARGWQPAGQLTSTANAAGAAFGWSLALQGDRAAVGAPHATTVYGDPPNSPLPHGDVFVFQRSAERWLQSAQLQAQIPRNTDYFGIDVALVDDGLIITASGDNNSAGGLDPNPQRSDLPNSGAFYLFAGRGTDWTQTSYVKSSMPVREGLFAHTVKHAGETIVVGAVRDNGAATGSGSVHVFR